MPAHIWIDVEDLFEYARENTRPSGIQRLAFEMSQALQQDAQHAGQVHFVRHAPVRNSFRTIAWADIAALFDDLTSRDVPASPREPVAPSRRGRLAIRRLVQRLPVAWRRHLTDIMLANSAALRAWGRLLSFMAFSAAQLFKRPGRRRTDRSAHPADLRDFATSVAAGDIILVLGSPWFHPDYPGLIARHREQYGVRFAMLVYDLIPLRRPEWCDQGLVRLFRAWFIPMLPLCDHVFAISQATAADVAAFAAETGVVLPSAIQAIPIGTGMTAPVRVGVSPQAGRTLPAPGSYALIVSTIEARKNHQLLFRVWRRLLDDLPRAAVPTLVFAGRIGWLVDDLMRQIANTDHLGGKLVVLESPTDAELSTLYAGCLFTLFPSFFEGWGLPVTESLSFGKPCLIADRTSLPEAGGSLARSFDPDNLHDAYRVIRDTIRDRDGLTQWQAQIGREFKPVSWSATAATLLAGLGLPDPFASRPARSDDPVPGATEECLHQQDDARDQGG